MAGKGDDFVGAWMSIAASARSRVSSLDPEHRQRACEHETVKVSLANLKTFPWIKERVADAYYDPIAWAWGKLRGRKPGSLAGAELPVLPPGPKD